MADVTYDPDPNMLGSIPGGAGTALPDFPGSTGVPGLTPPPGFAVPDLTVPPGAVGQPGLEMLKYDPGQNYALDRSARALDEMDKQQSGGGLFGPKGLAILAAIGGDFRPAIALQEQQRKTEIARQLQPVIYESNKAIQSGDLDKGEAIISLAMARAGDRAPEIAQYLTQQQNFIVKRRQDLNNFSSFLDQENATAAMLKDKGMQHPEAAKLAVLNEHRKRGVIPDQAVLNNMMIGMRPTTREFEGQNITISTGGGDVRSVETLPRTVTPAAVTGIVGNDMAGRYGITTADLNNLLNGKPVQRPNGSVIDPKGSEGIAIRQEFNARQVAEANYQRAKLINLDPTQTLHLLNSGVTAEEIAQRLIGSANIEAGLRDFYYRRAMEQIAVIRAQQNQNVFGAAGAGYTPVVVDPSDPSFLQEAGPMTVDQVNASGGRVRFLRTPVLDAEVKPIRGQIQALDYLPAMIESIGDINTPKSRLKTGVNSFLSQWSGLAIGDATPTKAVVGVILNNAIEAVHRLPSVSGNTQASRDVATLKQIATGPFASTDDAMKIATYVQGRLKEILRNSVSVEPASLVPSQAPPQPTTPAAPGQQPFTQPGAPTAPGGRPAGPVLRPPAGQQPYTPQSSETTYLPGQKGMTPAQRRAAIQKRAREIMNQGQGIAPPGEIPAEGEQAAPPEQGRTGIIKGSGFK